MFVLEGVLLVAAVICVGVQLWAMAWKLNIAIKKAVRAISSNPVATFAMKVTMIAYFTLVVPTIDRAIN
jgi:F0F1-type ATP synthase membrane subunit c/vacuolar-type H+-ATPase subunit K